MDLPMVFWVLDNIEKFPSLNAFSLYGNVATRMHAIRHFQGIVIVLRGIELDD